MKLRLKSLAAAAAVIGVAAAAFALQPKEAAKPVAPAPAKKNITIGLVAKSQDNPVFQAARAGAEDAARELGPQYGVNVKIDWQTPNSEDAQKQADMIARLAAGGADGIAVSASDAAKLKVAIDAAVAKGVEVSTFDSDVPTSKRFAYYGTDDFAAGAEVAKELAKAMDNKGVVAILAGNPNAPNLQARVRGVRETLAKVAPQVKIKDTYYHKETPKDAAQKVAEVQAANPEITGWAFVGGWPLYTQNALDSVYGKAKVVSLDSLPETLGYLRGGQVEVLLGQKYYGWGYESVRLLLNKIVKGEAPSNPIVNAPLDRVTKAGVDEYAHNWDKWLPKGDKKDEMKK